MSPEFAHQKAAIWGAFVCSPSKRIGEPSYLPHFRDFRGYFRFMGYQLHRFQPPNLTEKPALPE